MEKKKSSIDWLIDQMIKFELVPKGIHFDNILFHQAKAMHKEEIEHAYRCGAAEIGMIAVNKPEQYYNETFGGQDNE